MLQICISQVKISVDVKVKIFFGTRLFLPVACDIQIVNLQLDLLIHTKRIITILLTLSGYNLASKIFG
jgi:hypothetical protein